MGLLDDGFFGLGGLVFRALLHVELGRQLLNGLAKFFACLLDVALKLADIGIGAGLWANGVRLAH